MSEASGGGERVGTVPKELASLVPGFDPSSDNVEIWTSKVELLLNTWPTDKLNELATRLILCCQGTAYQKLQLLRGEVLTGSEKGIQRLVEVVGGTWGQIPLEKKFELAEKALYRSSQKADESAESYLSRCDVTWTELLSKKVDLKELQAYIVLRGSKLGSEDKKRVIVESKAEEGSQLTMTVSPQQSGFLGQVSSRNTQGHVVIARVPKRTITLPFKLMRNGKPNMKLTPYMMRCMMMSSWRPWPQRMMKMRSW